MRCHLKWAFLVLLVAGLAAGFSGAAAAITYTEVAVPSGVVQGMEVVTLDTRPGVTLPLLLMQQPNAWATVILFTGGNGELGITPNGFTGGVEPSNFLVRSRELFFARGLNVAVVDPPSDRPAPDFMDATFRMSQAHAQDIAGVIEFLRQTFHNRVWSVGTTAGTLSVASTTVLLPPNRGPDGIVLTSGELLPVSGSSTLFDIDLAAIRVPTLVVHHHLDQCAAAPFSAVPKLVTTLNHAKPVEMIPITGGGPPEGDPCLPFGFHGFPGIELLVVNEIVEFIKNQP